MRWRRCYNGYQLMDSEECVVGSVWKDLGTWHSCLTDAFGVVRSTRYHDYFKVAKAELLARAVARALEQA